MHRNKKDEKSKIIGYLMGQFFTKLTEDHKRSARARVDSLVDSTLVLLEQVNTGNISPEFADYLRYIIKKSGEQKKIEILLREKRARVADIAA